MVFPMTAPCFLPVTMKACKFLHGRIHRHHRRGYRRMCEGLGSVWGLISGFWVLGLCRLLPGFDVMQRVSENFGILGRQLEEQWRRCCCRYRYPCCVCGFIGGVGCGKRRRIVCSSCSKRKTRSTYICIPSHINSSFLPGVLEMLIYITLEHYDSMFRLWLYSKKKLRTHTTWTFAPLQEAILFFCYFIFIYLFTSFYFQVIPALILAYFKI